jgi:hypothetical protein
LWFNAEFFTCRIAFFNLNHMIYNHLLPLWQVWWADKPADHKSNNLTRKQTSKPLLLSNTKEITLLAKRLPAVPLFLYLDLVLCLILADHLFTANINFGGLGTGLSIRSQTTCNKLELILHGYIFMLLFNN